MNDALTLFQQYKDPVYRLALSMTGSPADAEDVCQTVFLRLLEKQPELPPERERAWLLQVAANEYYPGIARKIYLKAYRYNMHLKPKCMLIELGAQNNTVEEIMNACEPLAHILAIVLK